MKFCEKNICRKKGDPPLHGGIHSKVETRSYIIHSGRASDVYYDASGNDLLLASTFD
jgi:hypothetical protein